MDNYKLLSNTTYFSNNLYRKALFFRRFHKNLSQTIPFLIICVLLVLLSFFLSTHYIDRLFTFCIGIVGIISVFNFTNKTNIKTLDYIFYEDYFIMSNQRLLMEIEYSELTYLVDTEDYYYFYSYDIPVVINKNGFTLGTNADFEKFIDKKIVR